MMRARRDDSELESSEPLSLSDESDGGGEGERFFFLSFDRPLLGLLSCFFSFLFSFLSFLDFRSSSSSA